ncbi:MAG: transaldolase family protein [Methylococcaceae bacterium]
MKLYLDTANPALWVRSEGAPPLAGVTTNPTLIRRADYPVTLETYHHLLIKAGERGLSELMLQLPRKDPTEAHQWLATLLPTAIKAKTRLVIKLPCHADWVSVIEAVKTFECPILLTGLSNPMQLLWAKSLGVQYVAPYLGRLEDDGRDSWALVGACIACQQEGLKLVAASIRSEEALSRLIALGAYAATISPSLVERLIRDPLTDQAIRQFEADSQQSLASPAIP